MADARVIAELALGAGAGITVALVAAFFIKGALTRQTVLRARSGVQLGCIYDRVGRVVYWEGEKLYAADWKLDDGLKIDAGTLVRLKPVAGELDEAEREAILLELGRHRLGQ